MYTLQDGERTAVLRTRPHFGVEARYRLDVVIEDIRPRGGDGIDALAPAAEIARQHFDGRARHGGANRLDDIHEVRRSAVGHVVARDRRDHHMAQAQPRCGLGDSTWLVGIERRGVPCFDRTESAAARTGIAHDEKRRGPRREALAPVGALGGLADGVELQLVKQTGDLE